DAHDPHHARPRVLDAVDAAGREVEARAGLQRHLFAGDVRDAVPLDDVSDLVVRVAVVGRAARFDDPDELGQLTLVEDTERPPGVRALLGAVGDPGDDALSLDLALGGCVDRHEAQVAHDRILLAGEQQHSRVGLKLVRLAGEFERPRTGEDVEDFLPVAGVALELPDDVEHAHRQALVDALGNCLCVSAHAHDGVSPERILTSRDESMLPPDTMQTTLPVPARPDTAAARASAPAPSATTRIRSTSRRTAAAVSSSDAL